MKTPQRILAVLLLLTIAQSASAISIVFDYSYDTNKFFTDPLRKNTLNQAGAYLGNRLQDQLTAINSGAGNNFTEVFFDPSNPSSKKSLSNQSVAANDIYVYVGASNLGTSTLGIGGAGGTGACCTQAFADNVAGRGQTGALAPTPTDFGPWGGSLGFNSSTNWYFDTDASTLEAIPGFDFFTVAVHELGHLLGIGTAGSWDAKISMDTNKNAFFTGQASQAAHGGAPVPLDADKAHWLAGATGLVSGSIQEAAMGPSIAPGQRKYFTDLDFAALKDIGWQVSPAPVPLPGALVLLFSGLSLMFAWGRRSALV